MVEEKISKTMRYNFSNWNKMVEAGDDKKYVDFTNKLIEQHYRKTKKQSDPIFHEIQILKEDQNKADEEVQQKLGVLRQINRKIEYLEGIIEEKKNKGEKK